MYENIGGKIKGLAETIFAIQGILSVIAGIVLICIDSDFILYGVLTLILGLILAWVSSWLIYGFGELIDKISSIEKSMHGKITAVKPEISKEAQTSTEIRTMAKCDFCGRENVEVVNCKLSNNFGTLYRNLCANCMEEKKAIISDK